MRLLKSDADSKFLQLELSFIEKKSLCIRFNHVTKMDASKNLK